MRHCAPSWRQTIMKSAEALHALSNEARMPRQLAGLLAALEDVERLGVQLGQLLKQGAGLLRRGLWGAGGGCGG